MLPSLSSACTHSLSRILAADYLLPRSDKTRYARDFLLLRIKDFNCFLLRNPVNFNCFLSHFNWVNTQIRSLIRVLDNDKHINQLAVTFSTEVKGRHSFIITAVFFNQHKFTLTYIKLELFFYKKKNRCLPPFCCQNYQNVPK